MMSKDEILNALSRPFDPAKISWRVGSTNGDKTKGIALAYIDARDVMYRLDEVFGMNWQSRYSHADKKTICEIGVCIDGEWIWRSSGAGDTDFEAEKGAISDAFKRAAVLFGIGRYLYSLPNKWVAIEARGKSYVLKEAPPLPSWATPEGWDALMAKRAANQEPEQETPKGKGTITPTTGAQDNINPERLEVLKDIAASIVDFADKGEWEDAFLTYDQVDDTEERIAVWDLLKPNSSIRSRLKKMADERKQPQKEAA